jgi:DNA N-6-adenine-methyltransferase Dam
MSSQLHASLDFARRLFGRVALRDWRSHHAIRMCVAQLGLAVREARRDPVGVNAACRKAGIKGRRLEVRVVRLVAGRRIHSRSDQVARWANAAAYIAHPPNGDEPPPTWRHATRYVNQRGGVRNLSNLYAGSRSNNSPFRGRIDEDAVYGEGLFYRIDEADTTTEWFTPKYIFDTLGCRFDLDPASPGAEMVPWIPADHHYTTNGLDREWFGFVWLNPPYGRNVLPLWLEKFARHGNGIALVPERTSTAWWQDLVGRADLILCVAKKIPFSTPAGEQSTAFPIGSTLVAIGEKAVRGLIAAHRNGLGLLLKPVPMAACISNSFAEAAE